MEEKKALNKKKIISQILFVILLTVVTMLIIFNFNDFSETLKLISQVDGLEFLYALLCLLGYILLWPLSLLLIAKSSGLNKNQYLDTYLIGFSEHFFNGITPFSAGGQPIQVYLYTKRDITAAKSTGIILVNFIGFMIAANLIALVALIYYPQFSKNFNNATVWMIIVGFAFNFLTLVFILMLATSRHLRNLFLKILKSLCKIKFLGKFLTKLVPTFENYCDNVQIASKAILQNKLSFVLSSIIRGIALLFYYAIPFFILRALGVKLGFDVFPFVILATSFAVTTMVWVPTPGGTGGLEFAFMTIFTIFAGVTTNIGTAGMVLWRALTYYLLLLISFGGYLVFAIRTKKLKNKNDLEN